MTDLDTLLAGQVERGRAVTVPALGALRRRAARRRRSRAAVALGSAGLVVAVGTGVVVDGLALPAGGVRSPFAGGGWFSPRDPIGPGLGAVSGRVGEVPLATQRAVTLRFTAEGGQYEVRTAQGATWELDLPPGTYRITAVEGGGVCNNEVTVRAGSRSRHDLLWPCDGRLSPGPPPLPPPPS